MKYKIVNRAKHKFQLFTIEITVEDLAELKGLWARFNLSNDYDDDEPEANGAYIDAYRLWDEINDELKKYIKEQS